MFNKQSLPAKQIQANGQVHQLRKDCSHGVKSWFTKEFGTCLSWHFEWITFKLYIAHMASSALYLYYYHNSNDRRNDMKGQENLTCTMKYDAILWIQHEISNMAIAINYKPVCNSWIDITTKLGVILYESSKSSMNLTTACIHLLRNKLWFLLEISLVWFPGGVCAGCVCYR